MAFHPVAGCKIYIGGALDEKSTDFIASDFTSQTWVEITGWTLMGDIGDQAQEITVDLIAERRTKMQKGTRRAQTMQNVFVNKPTDTGQTAVVAAEKTDFNYAIRVVLNDAPIVGASPKPGERLFIGMVTSAVESGGNANTPRNLNTSFSINSNIVKVAASAT